MRTVKRKLSQLTIDEKFIDLRPVNIYYVSRYRQAYRMGATMPLIVINEKTNMIVSGNHRYKAMIQEYGPDYQIEAIPNNYKTRADELIEFASSNAAHGNSLSYISKRRIAEALAEEGVLPEDIAKIFDVPVKSVVSWGEINVVKVGNKTRSKKSVPDIPDGEKMTKKEYRKHIRVDTGMPAFQQMETLTRWFNDGRIYSNDKNVNAAKVLLPLLTEFLEEGRGLASVG